MFIVNSLLKFGTELLGVMKKMSFKDFVIVVIIIGFLVVGYKATAYRNDYIDTQVAFENYKTKQDAKKFDNKLAILAKEKKTLEEQLEKVSKESKMHEDAAKRFLGEWKALAKNRPDKSKIWKKMESLNGQKEVCQEFTKYGISCFGNISS